jgi:DNA-binding Lrp family transcriptional regulator
MNNDNENVQLDEMDQQLIQELEKNGRHDYYDLAKRLDTSPATISRRIASLLRKNIIKIMAVPNPSRFGFRTSAYIRVHTEKNKVNDICSALSVYPEVHTIMTLMDNVNIIIAIHFPDPEMLYDFIVKRIAYLNGVLSVEIIMRADVKKVLYVAPTLLL